MENYDLVYFAGAIKHSRKLYGYTLKEVSTMTGVSVGQLCDIEHGRTLPSIGTFIVLANFYKQADLNFFFEKP